MSRMSISSVTWLGMLLIAPGWTRQTPVVRDGVRAAGRLRRGLDGQHDLRRGTQGILPVGHQHRAGVAALALELHPQRRRGRDRRHDADRHVLALEDRPLLDVQLDEGGVVIGRQPHVGRGRRESRPLGARRRASGPRRRAARRGRSAVSAPAQRPAADAADAEARRLLAREHEQLDRSPRPEAGGLQRADRLQPAEDADRAVVPAGVRDRVGVRAGADGGQSRVGPGPAGEEVADGSSRTVSPASAQSCLRKSRACRSGFGEEHARDGRRLGIAERRRASSSSRRQPVDIDGNVYIGHASSERVAVHVLVVQVARPASLPIATNHCGQYGAIQITSPCLDRIPASPSR